MQDKSVSQPVTPYRDPSPPHKPPKEPLDWLLIFACMWLAGLVFSFLGWAFFVHTGVAIQMGAGALVAVITISAIIKVLDHWPK